MKSEPSQIIGYLTAAATAIIALLVAYGFDVSQEQQTAILGVVAVVAPAIAGIIIRFNVFAPDTAKEIAQEAADTGTVPDAVK